MATKKKGPSLAVGRGEKLPVSKGAGLTAKGRAKYNAATGSHLKAPQPEGGARKRSFCARMSGNKGPMKDKKGRPTPKAKALARWNCQEDVYMNSLAVQVAEKLDPQAPADVWIQDFQKADPNKYHQFKNKTPAKKAQMAVAAHYAANEPSKK
mgnify:CR=1 FL=1